MMHFAEWHAQMILVRADIEPDSARSRLFWRRMWRARGFLPKPRRHKVKS